MSEKTSLSLHTVQSWVKDAISTQGNVSDVLHSAELQKYMSPENALDLLLPSQSLSGAERLDIYRKMYVLRMVDSMESDFPVLAAYMKDRFHEIVMNYVALYPSRSYTLNHLGNDFPSFLRRYVSDEDLDLIYDLALLEQTISAVIDIEETPILTNEELSTIQPEEWETLVLKPVAALKVLTLYTNAVEFLRANDDNLDFPLPKKQESYVMVFRLYYSTDYAEMSTLEYTLLELILNGNSLLKALDLLMHTMDTQHTVVESQVFAIFQSWVQRGIFRSLRKAPSD